MIAAAAQTVTGFQINWFDAVLLLMVLFGVYRGRKNGMSKEMIPLMTWVAIFIVCGSYYKLAAGTFKNALGMSELSSDVLGYVILACIIYLIFTLIKNATAKKLETSNLFGGGEFYLGVPAGIIRFICILLTAMALLNAKHYTPEEIAKHNAYVNQNFGSDFFSAVDLHTIQEGVFKKSLTGPGIKKILGPLFIDTTPPGGDKPVPKKKPVILIGPATLAPAKH